MHLYILEKDYVIIMLLYGMFLTYFNMGGK